MQNKQLNNKLFKMIINNLINLNFIDHNYTYEYLNDGFSSEIKLKIHNHNKIFLLKVNFNNLKANNVHLLNSSSLNTYAKNLYFKKLHHCVYYLYEYVNGESLNHYLLHTNTKETKLIATKVLHLLKQFNKQQTSLNKNHFKDVISEYTNKLFNLTKITLDEDSKKILNILIHTYHTFFKTDQDKLQIGLVHGDFHLGNIVIDKHFKIKVIDYLKTSYSYCYKDLIKLCIINFNQYETFIIELLKQWFNTHNENEMKALRLQFVLGISSYISHNHAKEVYKINNLFKILALFNNFKILNPFKKQLNL